MRFTRVAAVLVGLSLVAFGSARAQTFQSPTDFNPAPYNGHTVQVAEELSKWAGYDVDVDGLSEKLKHVNKGIAPVVTVFALPQAVQLTTDDMVRAVIAKNATSATTKFPPNHVLVAIGRGKDPDGNPFHWQYGVHVGTDLEKFTRYPEFQADLGRILKDSAQKHGLSNGAPKLVGVSDGVRKYDMVGFANDVESGVTHLIAKHGGPGHVGFPFWLLFVVVAGALAVWIFRAPIAKQIASFRGTTRIGS